MADEDAPAYINTFHPTHYNPASGVFYGYETMVPISGPPNSPLSSFVVQPATSMAPFMDQPLLPNECALLPSCGYEGAVASYAASVAPTEHGTPFFDASQSIPSPMPPAGYDQHYFHHTVHEQQVAAQYWQWHMDNHLANGYGPFAGWTPHYVAPPPHEHPVPLMLYVVPYQPPQQQSAIDYEHMTPAMTHTTVASPLRAPRRFLRNMVAEMATMSTQELLEFATTSKGESFLRHHYTADEGKRDAIHSALFKPGVLLELSKNRHGNYIVQTLIHNGGMHVVDLICAVLGDHWVELALDRYGSRVVQCAVEQFPVDNKRTIAHQFRGHERLLAVDGHASHVVVRLVETEQREMFQSFIDAFRRRKILLDVLEQYHGNRVLVEVVRRLLAEGVKPGQQWRDNVELRDIVSPLIENAELYTMHEHANRVMQLLVACEQIPDLRSKVLQAGIKGRVMQLSLTKYGSQVVEKALWSASPQELSDMCDEIVLPETWSNSMLNRDAVDVLAFDRYGNYVTQTLLRVYMEVLCGKRPGDLDRFHRVALKLRSHHERLLELSSGQKIIELLEKMHEEQLVQQAAPVAENVVATARPRDRPESPI